VLTDGRIASGDMYIYIAALGDSSALPSDVPRLLMELGKLAKDRGIWNFRLYC